MATNLAQMPGAGPVATISPQSCGVPPWARPGEACPARLNALRASRDLQGGKTTVIPAEPEKRRFRDSMLVKMLVIGFLMLLLLIPLGMVGSLVSERQSRSSQAAEEVAATWGSKQALAGPVLTVPYLQHVKNEKGVPITVTSFARLPARDSGRGRQRRDREAEPGHLRGGGLPDGPAVEGDVRAAGLRRLADRSPGRPLAGRLPRRRRAGHAGHHLGRGADVGEPQPPALTGGRGGRPVVVGPAGGRSRARRIQGRGGLRLRVRPRAQRQPLAVVPPPGQGDDEWP